jgi:glycosyltransferase involved in cell wall biosynthesis
LRILFISHHATISGAPISLLVLTRYFKEHCDWDFRILVRKRGPLLDSFSSVAPTQCYFNYQYYDPGNRRGPLVGAVASFLDSQRSRPYPTHAFRLGKQIIKDVAAKAKQKHHENRIRESLAPWSPDLVYSNTAMNGDVIDYLGITAPVVVHVRELETSLGLLDPMRLHAFTCRPICYFAVSNAVRVNLTENYGIRPHRIKIVPVAVESNEIVRRAGDLSQVSIRESLGLSMETTIVGAVGRVDERKGSDIFLEVAMGVIDGTRDRFDVAFVWVGDGPRREALRDMIQMAGLQDQIHFVGIKENPYPHMKCFDILLTCSRDDPFPRTNLEAAVLGKPVIAFAASGGSREFVEEDAGFVIPGLDAEVMVERTIELIKHTDLRKELGSNGRKKVLGRYDVSVVAPIAAEYVESLARQRPAEIACRILDV